MAIIQALAIGLLAIVGIITYAMVLAKEAEHRGETPADIAEEEGWMAAMDGTAFQDNPYMETVLAKFWSKGWRKYMKQMSKYYNRRRR